MGTLSEAPREGHGRRGPVRRVRGISLTTHALQSAHAGNGTCPCMGPVGAQEQRTNIDVVRTIL